MVKKTQITPTIYYKEAYDTCSIAHAIDLQLFRGEGSGGLADGIVGRAGSKRRRSRSSRTRSSRRRSRSSGAKNSRSKGRRRRFNAIYSSQRGKLLCFAYISAPRADISNPISPPSF